MRRHEHEMGKWDRNPLEPREPFLPDEAFQPEGNVEHVQFGGLHLPKKPLNLERLRDFLIELKPLVEHIHKLSRQEQHKVSSILQDVKNELNTSDFSREILSHFEKVAIHFSSLLMHSTPIDKEAVLHDIARVESML